MRWVLDANIIFDFAAGHLLNELFRLPLAFCAPDLLVHEMVEPPGADLVTLGLEVHSLDSTQVVDVIQLRVRYNRLSVPDLSAFVLARDMGAGLLTGDRDLRTLAQATGVEVHGTLWLIDGLLTQTVVTVTQARQGLAAMKLANRRLPDNEMESLLRRWEKR